VWRSFQQGGEVGREALNLLSEQAMSRSKLFNGNWGCQQGDACEQEVNVRIACTTSACGFARFGETLAKQHDE
jgi:hypothetical protein